MSPKVVEHEYVTATKSRQQSISQPVDDALRVGRSEHGAQLHPTGQPNGAQQREVPPQFMGVRSTYSCPRLTQAWLRAIAALSPDSSTKTRLEAGICRILRRNALRFFTTSGRSCSSGLK